MYSIENIVSGWKGVMNSVIQILLLATLLGFVSMGCRYTTRENILSGHTVTGQLVFCGRPKGSNRFDMFLMDLNTDKWVNLTEENIFKVDNSFGHSIGCDDDMFPYRISGAAWSPNGSLLIVNAGGPYFLVPYILEISNSGEILKIVEQWPTSQPGKHTYEHPINFAWSPNGDKIAFDAMTDFDGYSNLYLGDVSKWERSNPGTPVVQLTYEFRYFPGVVYAPSWSPDGKKIAVSLAGPTSGVIIVSTDGTQSIYVSNETSAKLSSVENPSPWVAFPSAKPSWSPDGREVIFIAASTPKERTALFKVNENGDNLTELIPGGVNNAIYSPGGDYIAFIEYSNNITLRTVGRIVIVDSNGSNRQVISIINTDGIKSMVANYYIRDLSWSSDGKWLAFTSNHSGQFQLYIVSIDDRNFRKVINFPGDAVYPQWRPNSVP